MQKKKHSPQILRKRKFFLFLPLLILPFTTLLFWAVGGGKGSDASAEHMAMNGNLNMQLPDAYLKEDGSLTKLSYYDKAASDSAKLQEQIRNDPYYLQRKAWESGELTGRDTVPPLTVHRQIGAGSNSSLNPSPYGSTGYADPNEARVYEKLHALNTAMNQATRQSNRTIDYSSVDRTSRSPVNSDDVDRLEQMMDRSKSSDDGEDPEMRQLDGMIEKILDIQHPERVKDKLKQNIEADKEQVFAVTVGDDNNNTSLLVNQKAGSPANSASSRDYSTNGFFSLVDDLEGSTALQSAIQAVIHETQTIVDGAIVKLRLVNNITINNTVIPKGSFVFGTTSLSGERLIVKINTIRYESALFPVQLSVVDMDGMEGVYVPGTITKDVVGSSAERAIQGEGITTLDPSLGAQAAGAGIEAAKSLLSRKVKLVKVTLKAGYHVLLRDERQKTSL